MSESQRKPLAEDVENEFVIDGKEAEGDGRDERIDGNEIDNSVQNMEVTHPEEIFNSNENINNNYEVVDMNDIKNDVNDSDKDNDDDAISSDDDDSNNHNCRLQRAMRNTAKSIDIILKLIKLFPMELQHKNKFGEYPLHTACENCHEDVVIKLIELYPDAAQHKNSRGFYPFHISFQTFNRRPGKFSENVVMRLIEAFPDAAIGPTRYGTALTQACKEFRSAAIITKLIEINPLAIQKCYRGYYPIHIAICNQQPIAVIKLLLDGDPLGMERRTFNSYDLTPFHIACEHGNNDVVNYLMQRSDMQINVRNKEGMTPLHYACGELRYRNVEMLLNHPDIHVNATNWLNETPLHRTAISYFQNPVDSIQIIQKLLDHPFIIVNQKNNNGKTPLDLMQVYLKGQEDRSILHMSYEFRWCKEIVNLLEEFPIKQRWQSYCYHVKEFTPTF